MRVWSRGAIALRGAIAERVDFAGLELARHARGNLVLGGLGPQRAPQLAAAADSEFKDFEDDHEINAEREHGKRERDQHSDPGVAEVAVVI